MTLFPVPLVPRGCARLFRVLGVMAAMVVLAMAASAAEPVLRSFDIKAGAAEEALKSYSAQSGQEVLFATASTRRVQTNAVRGEFTAAEALELLLRDTGLVATRDPASGIFSITRDPNVQRAAAMAPRPESPTNVRIENGTIKLEEYPVTGSRIRTLTGEQTIQPVLTVTSQQIERTGVSSLGEIFRYIPQVTSSAFGQLVQTTNRLGGESATLTATRVTATLRGAPAGGTLLLVNGRRVPKTGQETGADAYDISGVPISAIERIDVLLDGASAVYGADAMGGVINVILKKQYSGTEVRLNYENTFESDSGVMTATLTHGFSRGRLSGSFTLSREEANAMMWRDRWFLATFDRRPFGGEDFREGIGGRGQIRVASGNLPGLSTNRAGIPAGSNGVNVTVQDYANAPLPPVLDIGETSPYSTPYERRNAVANLEYTVKPWLRVFTDVRWNESRTSSAQSLPFSVNTLNIPANAPGNPFGVPLILSKTFHDVPPVLRRARTEGVAMTAGLRGDLARGWRYESTANLARSRPDLSIGGATLVAARIAQAFASGQQLILLHDSTTGIPANPPGTLEALAAPDTAGAERAETWTYDAQADGPAFNLPAGEVRVAAGAEYREEYVDFPLQPTTSTNPRAKNRYTSGYFAELSVPILSRAQEIPFVDRLEFRVAARHDRYTDFAADTNPSVGLMYRPVSSLMLRASYGEGYKVPTLSQLYASPSESFAFFLVGNSSFLDPLRNFEAVTFDEDVGLPILRRGNPDLRPERSKNFTAGVVLDVPRVKGLSFSANYFDTEYVDRAGSLSLTDRIRLFPDTVMRGPRLPGDPAGWPGPVIGYQDVAVNVALERIAGWDVTGKYSVATRLGEITVNLAASRVTRREVLSAPNLPPTIVSTPHSLPWQASGWIFWNKGPYDIGVLFAHRAKFRASNLAGARFTPAATRWDFQASYNFSQAGWVQADSWWGRALHDTRLKVTIFNVLDDLPPFAPSTLPDNTIVDSRLRRYAVSLAKKF